MQSRTHPGLVRSNNEDVALAEVLPHGARLLAVADGVGGTRGGEIASAAAMEALAEQLREQATDDPAEALRAAFQLANARVREARAGRPELASMSTTLVAALVRDGEAWLANVGDSRAYLVRDSRAERLTEDHSWVDEQIRMRAAGGRRSARVVAQEHRHAGDRGRRDRGRGHIWPRPAAAGQRAAALLRRSSRRGMRREHRGCLRRTERRRGRAPGSTCHRRRRTR